MSGCVLQTAPKRKENKYITTEVNHIPILCTKFARNYEIWHGLILPHSLNQISIRQTLFSIKDFF